MNTKVIALAIAGVIAVGGGAYLLTSGNNSDTKNSQSSETNAQENTNGHDNFDGEEFQGNLQSLRGDGKARECTMSYSDDAGSGTGTLFTDGKGRGRIKLNLTTERGSSGESNTLVTDDKVYSWTTTDSGSFGFVFDASTVQAGAEGSPTTSSTQTAGKDFSLKCKSWTVDESVLSVPSDVNFSALPSTQ